MFVYGHKCKCVSVLEIMPEDVSEEVVDITTLANNETPVILLQAVTGDLHIQNYKDCNLF
jgi:hypothetical protein